MPLSTFAVPHSLTCRPRYSTDIFPRLSTVASSCSRHATPRTLPALASSVPCQRSQYTGSAFGTSHADRSHLSRKHRRTDDHGEYKPSHSRLDNDWSRYRGSISINPTRSAGQNHVSRNKQTPAVRPDFASTLNWRMHLVKGQLSITAFVQELEKSGQRYKDIWPKFVKHILGIDTTVDSIPLYASLRQVYDARGPDALDEKLKYAFYDMVTRANFSRDDIKHQAEIADMRYPSEWYPATRTIQRTIHLHVGPTNSGKTYHALKRLESAATGMYAGPLRLLAHEIFTRLNAVGKPCTLVTGEERRDPPAADDAKLISVEPMASCTVEMLPLNAQVEVAVLDEIQMIGSSDRGWAWTQAVLGVQAQELHLCGEARSVPLIRELCASTGDKLVVHQYQRLSPLAVSDQSLNGDLSQLTKGDCVVCFSVVGIHAMRKRIEQKTGKRVAIVYGSLPPETRAHQAELFNDPNNDYDFLVASDAIGMGLNLSIRRVIFESVSRFNGYTAQQLEVADIKQIGGRAGRYRVVSYSKGTTSELDPAAAVLDSALPNPDSSTNTSPPPPKQDTSSSGYITTLEKLDFPIVQSAMASEPLPLKSAGIAPPTAIVERFARYFPAGTPYSFIIQRLYKLASMNDRFHLCDLRDTLWISDLIEPVRNLTISQRATLSACPASKQDVCLYALLLPALASCVADQRQGILTEILEMPLEILDKQVVPDRKYLRELELLHKGVVCYLWLGYRFVGVFPDRQLAFHVKSLVEDRIEIVLNGLDLTGAEAKSVLERKRLANMEKLGDEIVDEDDEVQSAQSDRHTNSQVGKADMIQIDS